MPETETVWESSPWWLSFRADPEGAAFADRHYSRKSEGSKQFVMPGRCLCLVNDGAVWVTSWQSPQFVKHEWPDAWLCSLFRREHGPQASTLIRWAVAHSRWKFGAPPSSGMITFVDESKVRRKRDAGRCFRKAGFEPVGRTKDRRLIVLQCLPEAMPEARPPAGQLL